MKKQKKDVLNWIKAHKKELIIAGISITAIIATIRCYKNGDSIEELWLALSKKIDKPPIELETVDTMEVFALASEPEIKDKVTILREAPQFPYEVSDHIRSLPEGWHASPEKVATAAEHGFVLSPGQTWVENYTKAMQTI